MGKYSIQFYGQLDQGSQMSNNTGTDLNSLTTEKKLYPRNVGVKGVEEGSNYKITWSSYNLHKQVYCAGKLELTFEVATVNSNDNLANAEGNKAFDSFKQYKSLRLQDNDVANSNDGTSKVKGTMDLLTHYVIFSCRRIVKGNSNSYAIVITAYSPDKLLTIDKFNRAFTGKKFYADMVSGYLGTSNSIASAKSTSNLTAYNECGISLVQSLRNLSYKVNKEDTNGKVVTEEYEALLPYTVQYNESIWDFLVRIASRNGEFLYYENGNLQVGLPNATSGNTVDFVASVAEDDPKIINKRVFDTMEEDACGYFQDASILFDNDYLDSQRSIESTNVSNANDLYNSECIISPEINELVQKTDFSTIDDYVQHVKFMFDSVGTFFKENTILDAIRCVGLDAFNSYHSGTIFVDSDNDKFDKYYFPESNAKNDNPVDTLYAEKKKEGEEAFYLFASSLRLLNNQFYHAVCKESDSSRKNMLTFQFKDYVNIALGSVVKYNSATYRVWSVEMEHDNCTVKVIPVVQLSDTTVGKIMTTENSNEDYCIPIIDSKKRIAKATSQRAVVVDNYDPLKLGRVRVRYPWQPVVEGGTSDTYAGTKYNDISPWLRIVLPMASDGAGFMFMPNKGDEVMVDYEDGNIDRPYVCGSMYSINHQPGYHASTQLCGKTKSICTNNGHHLAFTDKPGDVRMFARMIPIWSQLSKCGVCNGKDLDKELLRYTTGGFEIADYLGIYSISGSTESRSISIDSPIGKVSVSALTGISIEAPLGDVSIVGKNVTIEARNSLNIESGTNIGHRISDLFSAGRKSVIGSLPKTAEKIVKGVAGLDFGFIRCMAEALLKPIGGGLAIKSHRYITIASGDGEAKFDRNYSYDKVRKSDGEFRFRDMARLFTNAGDSKVDDDINVYKNAKTNLIDTIRIYNNIHNDVRLFADYVGLINECLKEKEGTNIDIVAPGGFVSVLLNEKKDLYAAFMQKTNSLHGDYTRLSIMDDLNLSTYLQSLYTCKDRIELSLNEIKNTNQYILENVLDEDLDRFSNLLSDIDQSLSNGDNFKLVDYNVNISRFRAKNLLFKLIKKQKCISQYLEIKAEPDSMEQDDLQRVIKLKQEGKLGNIVNKVGNYLGTRLLGENMLEDWSWSKNTKGGIVISNNEQNMFTFNNGQFSEIEKEVEKLPNELIKDITTLTI